VNPDDEDDEDTTVVECPKCGNRPAPGHVCDLCHGSGCVTASARAFWRAGNLARGSGQFKLDLGAKK